MSQFPRFALIFLPTVLIALTALSGCSVHFGGGHGWHGVRGSGVEATVQHQMPVFTAIQTSGSVELIVTVGNSGPVEVTADDNILPHLRIEVEGDTLIVEPRHSIRPKTRITVRAATPTLASVSASGATDITVHNVDSPKFTIDISGAAEVDVTGRCGHLDAGVSGAAELELAALIVQTAEIRISGAGEADVHAEQEVRATVSGAGEIRNHGAGKVIGNVSGAGSIHSVHGGD